MKFSKIILICMLIFLVLFTVANLVMGFVKEYEQSTLVGCVFAFCSVEGGLLAWIKHFKQKDKLTKEKKD